MTWFLLMPVGLAAGTAVSMQFGVNSQLRGVAQEATPLRLLGAFLIVAGVFFV